MKNNIIKVLEELITDDLCFEDQSRIINEPKIKEKLDALFKQRGKVSIAEIYRLSSNQNVQSLIKTYYAEKKALLINEKVHNGDSSLNEYLSEIENFYTLSEEEEKELFYNYNSCEDEKEKRKIKDTIINHNLKLVVYIVKLYNSDRKNKVINMLDLIQEGNLGLVQAVDRFDVEKGNKFSTYASWWIKKAINEMLKNKSETIRHPVHLTQIIRKMQKEIDNNNIKNGVSLESDNKIIKRFAKEYNVSEKILTAALSTQTIASLDNTFVGECSERDLRLINCIADTNVDIESEVLDKIYNEQFNEFLDNTNLSSKELKILKLRYGFDDDEPKTLAEVGTMLDLTHEGVRMIEKRALKKLKILAKRKAFSYNKIG